MSVLLFCVRRGLDESEMAKFSVVGVTAGASTPEFIIRSVCEKLETI